MRNKIRWWLLSDCTIEDKEREGTNKQKKEDKIKLGGKYAF